ncbi:MAG: GNAT family N-acetyltransferase [Thermoanaerobaculia bacterium]
MQIRAINQSDRPQLEKIVHHAGNFTPEEIETAMELIDESIESPEEYETFVLEDEQEIRGYVCIGPTPLTDGVYDLYWIVVDSTARGRRYGQKLLRHAEEEVKRRKGRMLLIETSSQPSYESTNRFYINAGYPEVARIRNFYKKGDDKIVYAKEF